MLAQLTKSTLAGAVCAYACALAGAGLATAAPPDSECGPYAGEGTALVQNFSSADCNEAIAVFNQLYTNPAVQQGSGQLQIGIWDCHSYGTTTAKTLGYAAVCLSESGRIVLVIR